jgi:hypothetical protein
MVRDDHRSQFGGQWVADRPLGLNKLSKNDLSAESFGHCESAAARDVQDFTGDGLG